MHDANRRQLTGDVGISFSCTDYWFQMQMEPTHNINSRQHTDPNSLRMTRVDVSLQATIAINLAGQVIEFKCQQSLCKTSNHVSITDYKGLCIT